MPTLMWNNKPFVVNKSCQTSEELVKSKDFRKGVAIVLKRFENYNKKYIMDLLERMSYWQWTQFTDKEIADLKAFFSDEDVIKFVKNRLTIQFIKLRNIEAYPNHLLVFSRLLTALFEDPKSIILDWIDHALLLDDHWMLFRAIVDLCPWNER